MHTLPSLLFREIGLIQRSYTDRLIGRYGPYYVVVNYYIKRGIWHLVGRDSDHSSCSAYLPCLDYARDRRDLIPTDC